MNIEISVLAIFQYDPDGICVNFPNMPECNTCGFSRHEAKAMAKDALTLCLHGKPIQQVISFKEHIRKSLLPNQEAVMLRLKMEVREGLLFSSDVIEFGR